MTDVDTSGWETWAVPGTGLSFRLPAVAPSGAPVDLDDVRLHFRSRDTDEVYGEVSRHLLVSASSFFERESAFVVERYGATVEPLQSTVFAGGPAWAYSFAWADKKRQVVLVERGDWLYRIVVDPASDLSRAVLATVELPAT